MYVKEMQHLHVKTIMGKKVIFLLKTCCSYTQSKAIIIISQVMNNLF